MKGQSKMEIGSGECNASVVEEYGNVHNCGCGAYSVQTRASDGENFNGGSGCKAARVCGE